MDFGITFQATVHTDVSAALAIAQRHGLGKLRHIAVHWLWVQEHAKRGSIETKHLPVDEVHELLDVMAFEVCIGRSEKALTIIHVNGGEGKCYSMPIDED